MNYISTESIFGQVKEEMISYFSTGEIDDLMWPKYVSEVLKTLYKSALPVRQVAITIQNNQGTLPDDFDSVKEVWACGNITYEFPNPSSYYYQKDCRLDNITDPCHVCNQEASCDDCDPCKKQYLVVHKVTGSHQFSYNYSHPLKPGNLQARNKCSSNCLNLRVESPDTFSIDGCNIYTSMKDTAIHLVYYANGMDENDEQLIPDNHEIEQYLLKYLKFKMFDKLWNSAGGDTFNQAKLRRDVAEAEYLEAKIKAFTELKKENKSKSEARMTRTENRYNKYYNMLGFRR